MSSEKIKIAKCWREGA